MKAYILKIVGAALLAAFSEYLVPANRQKYMKLVSGLIIISVLISPFAKNVHLPAFDEFPAAKTYTEEGEALMSQNIKTELEKNISEDIVTRVYDEFCTDVEASTRVRTDPEGKIESVERIELKGKENSKITERLKFVYGTEEVVWID